MPPATHRRRRAARTATAAVLGLVSALLAALLAAAPASAATGPLESFELELVRLHNESRAAAGLAPLDVHVTLHSDARRWSREMAERGRLMHQSSANGYTPFSQTSCAAADPGWRSCSENVGAGQPSPGAVHSTWMASAGHRANILDPAINRVGIGVWSDGRQLWWTARYLGGTSVDTVGSTRHPQDGEYDPDGAQGTIYRLYRAYFLREPDGAGYAYWLSRYRSGESLVSISDVFSGSSEFRGTYGSRSDSSFVDLVYRNVLGRPPEPEGHRYWLDQLARGMTRGRMMISFSDSGEFRARTADGVPPDHDR